MKILRRSRRTCSSCTGQMIWSQSRPSSSGPFTVMVSNLSFGSGGSGTSSSKAHPPHVSPHDTAGHQARYPASYTETPGWKVPGLRSLLSCCLSATGIRFLGVLFPPRDSASLTVGLPPPTPAMDLTGFPRSTRMRHGRVGRHLYPGSDGVHATVDACSVAACRFSTARSSSSWHHHPTQEVAVTRHQRWFTHVRPFGLPLACGPQSEPGPLGFPPGFAPGHYWPRTPGQGSVLDTDRSHVFDITSNLQSTDYS